MSVRDLMNNRQYHSNRGATTDRHYYPSHSDTSLQDHIEGRNEAQVNLLHEKLASLKSVTIDIQQEVHEQNTFLDQFGLDMDKATGFLSGTMKRLKYMTREQSTRYILYFILFAFIVFVIFYLFIL